MRRRVRIIAVAMLLIVLLSGCDRLLNRPYRSLKPRLEPHAVQEDQASQQVENYTGLKTALVELINQHKETGIIKFNNYTGDPKADMSRACFDIMREDPLGAYAVDYMSPQYTTLVSEASVTITYRPDRPLDISSVDNASGLAEAMKAALKQFESKILVEVEYFARDTNIDTLLQEAYYNLPEQAVGMPVVSVTYYPDSGLNRIVDMRFSYPDTRENMQLRVEMADKALRDLIRDLPYDLDAPHRALWLYDRLCQTVKYDETVAKQLQEGKTEGLADDLYGALVEKRAVSAGYALTYKRMCDLSGIQCQMVTGLRGNTQYAWNIIQLDEDWYHVDPASDAIGGTHDWFLKTDEEMQPVARWNQSTTPGCEATAYSYASLTKPPEPDPNVSPAVSLGEDEPVSQVSGEKTAE